MIIFPQLIAVPNTFTSTFLLVLKRTLAYCCLETAEKRPYTVGRRYTWPVRHDCALYNET